LIVLTIGHTLKIILAIIQLLSKNDVYIDIQKNVFQRLFGNFFTEGINYDKICYKIREVLNQFICTNLTND